jgi:putative molybdenum carrier protein
VTRAQDFGLEQIVSGGQTGADRAALDAACALGIATGGWLPRGRRAEDGPLDECYAGMRETGSDDPAVRTQHNVRDSDATLIVSHGPLTGGSALTARCAAALDRPLLHLDLSALDPTQAVHALRTWLAAQRPRALNVAGPRASGDPAIYAATRTLLEEVLGGSPGGPSTGPETGSFRSHSGRG